MRCLSRVEDTSVNKIPFKLQIISIGERSHSPSLMMRTLATLSVTRFPATETQYALGAFLLPLSQPAILLKTQRLSLLLSSSALHCPKRMTKNQRKKLAASTKWTTYLMISRNLFQECSRKIHAVQINSSAGKSVEENQFANQRDLSAITIQRTGLAQMTENYATIVCTKRDHSLSASNLKSLMLSSKRLNRFLRSSCKMLRILASLTRMKTLAMPTDHAHGVMLLQSNQPAILLTMPRIFHLLFSNAVS